MPGLSQKKRKPEEIVAKPRQVDVLLSRGRPVAEAIRSISVTAFTDYRRRKGFGGLKFDRAKRLKELETDRAIAAPSVRGQWRAAPGRAEGAKETTEEAPALAH